MRSIIIAFSLIATTYGALLVGDKQCTWGPSYWCSHIKASKECKATQHCADNYWNQQELSTVDQSDLCTKCDDLMDQIRQYLDQNLSNAEILQYVRGECEKLMPDEESANKCASFVGTNLKEIIALVKSKVSDRTICTVLQLCQRDSDVSEVDSKPSLKCVNCKKFIKDFEDMYFGDEAEECVADQLTAACRLCPVQDQCTETIRGYIDQAFDAIRDAAPPAQVCQAIHFCPGGKKLTMPKIADHTSVGLPVERMLNVNQLYLAARETMHKKVKSNQNNPNCMLCEWAVDNIDKQLKSNHTKEEIEKKLDEICSFFPKRYHEQCIDFMEEYGKQVMEEIENSTPEEVCEQVGACVPSIIFTKVTDNEECQQCKEYAEMVIQQIQDPDTQESIENAAMSFCRYAPGKYERECEDAVREFVPQFLSEIAQTVTPMELCNMLHLCQ